MPLPVLMLDPDLPSLYQSTSSCHHLKRICGACELEADMESSRDGGPSNEVVSWGVASCCFLRNKCWSVVEEGVTSIRPFIYFIMGSYHITLASFLLSFFARIIVIDVKISSLSK